MCFTGEADCRVLAWLVKVRALSEQEAHDPDPKAVAKAVGKAVSALLLVSAMADLD